MSCLGVLFAVGEDIIAKLRRMEMSKKPDYISEEIEELYFEEYPERTFELDKSWDAMHRALTDGSLCFNCNGYDGGLAILGGELLYFDGEEYDDYIITAKSPEQVKKIYETLSALTDDGFRAGYEKISEEEYPDKDDEDFEYTLEYLRDSLAFWRFAAQHGLWVLFTADQ